MLRPLSVIRYEHPLNERIRTLMRLEDLYHRAQFFAAQADGPRITRRSPCCSKSPTSRRAPISRPTCCRSSSGRSNCSRRCAPIRRSRSRVLEPLLADIDRASAALLAQTGKAGVHLRDNEWLMTIKQRTAIPGGVCEFDLPAYHYWLNGDPAARQNDLHGWIEPFLPIYDGLAIILRLLRDNGRATRQTAYRGVFQLMLTTSKVAQLLRLTVPLDLPCVPEISANKYALNIRFIGVTGMDRGTRLRPRRRIRARVLQSLT